MIAKLERTQSTAEQNMDLEQNPPQTMGATTNSHPKGIQPKTHENHPHILRTGSYIG